MKILAIEASGLVAGCALADGGLLLGDYNIQYKKTHSQTLMPMMAELRKITELDLASVDAIAITEGPGSFTGLRIGASAAKGLGLALEKPIIPVPTLDSIAFNLFGTDALVCPMMDARRETVYTGIYEEKSAHVCLLPQCALPVREIVEKLNSMGHPVIFLGDGADTYRELIDSICEVKHTFAPAHLARQRAGATAILADHLYRTRGKETLVDADSFRPVYLKQAQAERERRMAEETGQMEALASGSLLRVMREKQHENKEDPARSALWHIRRMTQEDLAGALKVENACFTEAWTEEVYRSTLQLPYAAYYVAEIGGEIVGTCGVLKIAGTGEIYNVGVLPACRRKGIAHSMLECLLREAREDGVKSFVLEVREGSTAARSVYESLGFRAAGVRRGLYTKPEEDGIVMQLGTENEE